MTIEITNELQRRLGIELFNYTWDLLDKTNRTEQETLEMIHAAHASRYHWEKVGTPINHARGEWQISRVYSVVGRAEPARFHARLCLEICETNQFGDFDLAYAYEAMARASAVAGDLKELDQFKKLAFEAAQHIQEEEDKKLFMIDLSTLP